MTNKSQKSQEELAMEIARFFKEEERLELFQQVLKRHDEAVIKKAFEITKNYPASKIKKSRSALFFFLLNKYAEK